MKTNQKKAWLYLAPTIIFVTLFSIYPILRAFGMSFQSGSLIDLTWTGFNNYKYIFNDPEFWLAIKNTLLLCGNFGPGGFTNFNLAGLDYF